MILGGIEVNQFTQIGLILEAKLGDDLLPANQTGWIFSLTIIQPFSDKEFSGIIAISHCNQ